APGSPESHGRNFRDFENRASAASQISWTAEPKGLAGNGTDCPSPQLSSQAAFPTTWRDFLQKCCARQQLSGHLSRGSMVDRSVPAMAFGQLNTIVRHIHTLVGVPHATEQSDS